MKPKWNRTMGALALSATTLSAMALGIITPSAAIAYEEKGKGQHFIKDRPVVVKADTKAPDTSVDAPPATEKNQLCGVPYTPPCRADAPSTNWETGQILIKDRPVIKAARVKAGGGTSGWVIPVASALAVGAGVLAATSGDNNAASPN